MKFSTIFSKIAAPVILLTLSLQFNASAQTVTYTAKNTATATGTAAGTITVTDVSNNGTINQLLGDQTPVNFPMIGVSKTASTPDIQADGSYNITYTINVQNFGAIDLNSVQVTDDLTTAFGTPMTFTKSSLVVSGVTSGSSISANTSYDGSLDKNMLTTSTGNVLKVGASATITLKINVVNNNTFGIFNNSAKATGVTNTTDAVTVQDLSTNNASPNHSSTSNTPLDFDDLTPVTISAPDLNVTKTVNITPLPAKANVNTNVTFTVTVNNTGGDAAQVSVADALPPGYTFVNATPSTGTAYSSTTGIWTVGILAHNASATLAIVATVLPNDNTASDFLNTATASITGYTDPSPLNNTASISVTPIPVADLSITNSDGIDNYVPGAMNTYTVVVTNNGPSNVTGATIANTLPPGSSWTASYASGATGAPGGVGDILQTVDMLTGSTITYTVTVPVPSNQTGNLVNTATATLPTGYADDPTPANNIATDTDIPTTDLSITDTDNKPNYVPGTNNTYVVVVNNNGADVTGATVATTLPLGSTWTAVFSTNATGTTSGSNSINQLVNIPNGGTVTYTIVAPVSISQTGNLTNTATVTAPTTVAELTNTNNTASDTDIPSADLSIINTDGIIQYIPGTNNTYTITAQNTGPGDAPGSIVTNTLPSGITGSWTALYSGGATGNASGTGSMNETVNMPSGGKVVYTYVVGVPPGQTGTFTNTANIALSAAITAVYADPTPLNNTASDIDAFDLHPDLSITNTDSKTTYIPGTINTYTVVATNTGTSDVPGAEITYPFPTGVTGTWTAMFSTDINGTATGTASGTGAIDQFVNMPAGTTVTYTITANVASGVTTNPLITTATIITPTGTTDSDLSNNVANDSDVPDLHSDLSITNTDDKTTYIPGTSNTYTVVAKNNGNSDVTGAEVTYPFPTGVTGTWTAVFSADANGTATGTASGTGAIDQFVNMPAGTTVTYTITANVASGITTNPLTTLATIIAPSGTADDDLTNNTASDADALSLHSDLSITNTDSKTQYIPGTSNTYTVVAKNNGNSDVTGAEVTYPFPTGVTGTWTAVYSTDANGTATGTASGTGAIDQFVNMPAGTTVTYTITANVASGVTANPLTTLATVIAPSGTIDSDLTNNTASDPDALSVHADLSITNTDGKTQYIPGTSNTYTVVVKNNGTSDITGAEVTYPFPTGVTGTWTAVFSTDANGTATGTVSGTGAIDQLVNMPVGTTVTYTITANVGSGVIANPLTTTATVIAPSGTIDSDLTNNAAGDSDTPDLHSDLSITNTDGKTLYTPGTTNTYTVVVSNTGPSDVVGATVTNPLPAGVTGTWTAVLGTGAAGTLTGTGGITQIVNIPAGSSITYTIVANIASNVTGVVATTATVALPVGVTDPTPLNNTATDTDTDNPVADLSITNTDGKVTYTPGVGNTYTVVVTNGGPTDVIGATVTNPFPTGLTGTWTATFTGGSTGTSSGSGDITQTVNVPSGGTITYTLTTTVPSTQTGDVVSTAKVNLPAGFTDPTPANNTAVDTDTDNPIADLSITNTDGKAQYVPGTSNVYTVVVTNGGPTNAIGALVTDPFPAGITGTWTATFTGGSTGTSTGTGDISQLVNMPPGSTIIYTITTSVASTVTGNLVSIAKVAVPAGFTDPTPANNTATDTDTQNNVNDLKIVKTVSGNIPSVNTQVTFTLSVTNNGPSAATGVTATDLMPTGFTYISAAPSVGTYNSSNGVWTIGNLANAGNVTMTIVAKVNAAGSLTNIATVTATGTDIDPTNNSSQVTIIGEPLPVANDDFGITLPNTPVTIDILGNDVKGFGDLVPGTVTVISPTTHGTVVIDPVTGKATYTPNPGYYGTDVFTYTVKDANGGTSNVATVTITINKPPVANNDSGSTTANVPVTIDILTNDVPGSSNLNTSSVIIIQQPQHGVVTIDPSTGKATYTPVTNYFGPDIFTYTVNGADGTISNVATVNITITDKPAIGLAKFAAAVDKQVDGSFNVTYLLTVENFGITVLNNVSITDDLSATFKGQTLTVVNIKSLGSLTVNGLYDGKSVTEMLQAGNSLAKGDMQQIQVTVNVALAGVGTTSYLNSANASGIDVAGIKATDVSTDGIKPDPNVAGDVSPSDPTPVSLTKPKEFIPGGFSPNGDGINDGFVIENSEGRRMNLEIFNRWGNRVYHSADYKNDWDGKSNDGIRVGEMVPDGTYYYIVSFDGANRREGFMTIHR